MQGSVFLPVSHAWCSSMPCHLPASSWGSRPIIATNHFFFLSSSSVNSGRLEMYFLSLLATQPSITFSQQVVSTILLNICFSIGIQKAVSGLFSLVCWIKTMSPEAFRMSLGRSLWPLSYFRNVSACLPEMGTFNRFEDLQYRERQALLSRLQGDLLFFFLIICLYSFSLHTYPLPQASPSLLFLV